MSGGGVAITCGCRAERSRLNRPGSDEDLVRSGVRGSRHLGEVGDSGRTPVAMPDFASGARSSELTSAGGDVDLSGRQLLVSASAAVGPPIRRLTSSGWFTFVLDFIDAFSGYHRRCRSQARADSIDATGRSAKCTDSAARRPHRRQDCGTRAASGSIGAPRATGSQPSHSSGGVASHRRSWATSSALQKMNDHFSLCIPSKVCGVHN